MILVKRMGKGLGDAAFIWSVGTEAVKEMEYFEKNERATVTKGIILAVDSGAELCPMAQVVAKCLMPVYDKPMIYYPLSTLMLAGIREILIITAPRDMVSFMQLLGNGSRLGVSISYAAQPAGDSMADGFLVGQRFIGEQSVCLVRGDSIFHGEPGFLPEALKFEKGARIFARRVKHPDHRPVVQFDRTGKVLSLEEKAGGSRSAYAVAGLYLYDKKLVEVANLLRAEHYRQLTIMDVNREYLKRGELWVRKIGRGVVWLEVETEPSLLEASNFVANVEKRSGVKIGCIEEAAFRMGFIDPERLGRLIRDLPENGYRDYLTRLATKSSGEGRKRVGSYLPQQARRAVGAAR